MQDSYYNGIQHIVHLSTNIETSCEHCNISVGGDQLAESVNHYIEQHGYKVLHIGTETNPGIDGNPYHSTVVVLGK